MLFIGRRRQKKFPFIEVQLVGERVRRLLVKVFQKLAWHWAGIGVAIWPHERQEHTDPGGAFESFDVLLGLGPSQLSIGAIY